MENDDIIRLLPKRKRDLKRLIFSRAGLIILLLLLEIAVLFAVYSMFNEYFRWFRLVQYLFSIGMVFYLFRCDMDATAKLTWLNLIMLFPVPATILLWGTRHDIGHRLIMRRVAELTETARGMIPQHSDILDRPEITDSATDDLCRYLNRSGCFPLYADTQVTYLESGEAKFAAMLEALQTAEHFIYLEYFIIGEGYMWGRVLKILAEKAAQGVDVRVMYDGMCEMSTLSRDYPERLQALGIKCKPFSRIYPFISTHYNYRDHRKILVVDGKTAFNGGVNLADEYINRVERFGHWKDAAVMLRGAAVQSFTLMFLQMWNLTEPAPQWQAAEICVHADADGYVMPFSDCPLDSDKVGESVYMDILSRAKTYVHIMTPYLILDNELETALKFAAERGVDVRLILPGIPDKKASYALAKTHYAALTEAGVHIYEYTPGFVHAKVFVCDDEKAVVGTINLDYRSLYHHFECATYLYRCECIGAVEQDFQQTLAQCRAVTPETIKNERLGYKILGSIMKLVAPLF